MSGLFPRTEAGGTPAVPATTFSGFSFASLGEDLTVRRFEINRGDVGANCSAEISGFDMFGMDVVSLEAGAIRENGDEAGIIGAGQAKDIESYLERFRFWNFRGQIAKHRNVFFPHFRLDVGSVFPNYKMSEHGSLAIMEEFRVQPSGCCFACKDTS